MYYSNSIDLRTRKVCFMHKMYRYALLITCYFAQCFAKPPIGLANCGNSCYMNSVLQLLYAMPKFKNSLLLYWGHFSPDSRLGQLYWLFREMDESDKTSFTMQRMTEARDAFIEKNMHNLQDDAGTFINKLIKEFTSYFVQSIQDDLKKHLEWKFEEIDTYNDQVIKKTIKDPTYIKQVTFTTDFSKIIEHINGKPFTFPIYQLNDGRKVANVIRKTITTQLPPNALIRITLKNENLGQKVVIPTTIELLENEKPFLYNLIGGIVHIGTTIAGGHYIAYVKHDDIWYECNDAVITQKKPFFINPKTTEWPANYRPTILLYERDECASTLSTLATNLAVITKGIE